jgi:hypothetical protein
MNTVPRASGELVIEPILLNHTHQLPGWGVL